MFGLPKLPPIYMDYAATTPVDAQVVSAMLECMSEEGVFANASSVLHSFGRAAAARVEAARAQLAAALGVDPASLIWTSGATESDNLAITGVARYRERHGKHLISSRVEHKAVIDPLRQLEAQGFDVTWLEPGQDGRISAQAVQAALREDTSLVSLMWVNNETGAINDIAAIAEVVAQSSALLHVDAAQAFGKIKVNPSELAIDLMSITAHKCYGPKGIGALYMAPRVGVNFEPLLFGGGQEKGLRPGTLATHQIVGFGAAAEAAQSRREDDYERLAALGERLLDGLLAIDGVQLNGSRGHRLPWLINVSVADVEGESLLYGMREVALATGSACNTTSGEPSFVLRALGRSDTLAQSSLRFSLGRGTTSEQVEQVLARFAEVVTRLRALAGPLLHAGGAQR